jgi:hypothetical protein
MNKKIPNDLGGSTKNIKQKAKEQQKFYKYLAGPILVYGSESWSMRKKHESKVESTEMKLFRSAKGYTRPERRPDQETRYEL